MAESKSPALSSKQEPDVAQQPPPTTNPEPQGQRETSQTSPGIPSASNIPIDAQQVAPPPQDPSERTPEPVVTAGNDKTPRPQDVTMGGTDIDPNASTEGNNGLANGTNSDPIPPPTKKHTSLREFLGQMDEYAPIIPDAVTAHYLTIAGLPPPGNGPNQTPPHLARLLALATQKFIADIAADAYQYSRIRASNSSTSNNPMGAINVTAGLNVAANQTGNIAGAGGQGSTGEQQGKGKGGTSGMHLGVQRSGFGGGGQGSGQGKTVLTMEDLGMAVAEYGVTVKRGEFYR
ncbi:hypothetical protein LOZ58_006173 [Ophidiomyces ophidiicola]|nr:hypothetical protein LOZ65_004705 [Ophidiomyces ophidiicola]KAI1940684.1 hypothetical protein LOZ66_002281 [Ophidiomyces ophidiicola]KAI1956671.1 hypothetical protein LOZ58_006173 [Ophidiomyces ophidiicola]